MTDNMTQTNNEREALLKTQDFIERIIEHTTDEWANTELREVFNFIEHSLEKKPISQNEQQEAVAEIKQVHPYGGTIIFNENYKELPIGTKLYASPPKQAIPDITVETKLPFDIYFGKGKVGKGCTFSTLIKRISAQSSFVDELISENEELRKKLGIPSKRELFNKMLNAAPTNTEVGG